MRLSFLFSKGHVNAINPLDHKSAWRCSRCKVETPGGQIADLVEALEKQVSELVMSKDVYEEALAKFSRILHPNHHIMIDLEFTLVQLYGRGEKQSEDEAAMVKDAKRKLFLCEKVKKTRLTEKPRSDNRTGQAHLHISDMAL